MRVPTGSALRYVGFLVSMVTLSLSMAGCESAPNPLSEPNPRATLLLPLNASVESQFVNYLTSAPRLTVTIAATGIEVSEPQQPSGIRSYRLESVGSRSSAARLFSRTPAPPRLNETLPCRLRPGIYNIVEPISGLTVGILIVYPDCHTEIYTG
jgi:hypothetical protein